MSNEDYYLMDAAAAIRDVLEELMPELEEEARGDVAFEIASHLDRSHMFIKGYRRGSY